MQPPFPNLRCREIVREVFGDCVSEMMRLTKQCRPELTPDLIEAFAWGIVRGELLAAVRAPHQAPETYTFLTALMADMDENGFVRVSKLMHDVVGEDYGRL